MGRSKPDFLGYAAFNSHIVGHPIGRALSTHFSTNHKHVIDFKFGRYFLM